MRKLRKSPRAKGAKHDKITSSGQRTAVAIDRATVGLLVSREARRVTH